LVKFRVYSDVTCAGQTYAAHEVKVTVNGLAQAVVTFGLALTVFLALTMSVQFWLAVESPSGASAGAHTYPHPSYAYVTPDPHP
jgi:hypothetical protein